MVIFIITISFIVIYLVYPLWLKLQPETTFQDDNVVEIDGVSIIYISRNDKERLKEKIPFLLEEMNDFEKAELIVIDDSSTDGSQEMLENIKFPNLRTITKNNPRGIPHSMNLGVKLSSYQNIVFCDQRQILERSVIKKLVGPLKFDKVGAVSSFISSYDKLQNFYVLRAHENTLKKEEGKTGNLIGVYGPLYAIKKECYKEIPDSVILDDLYVTLHVLSKKHAVFQNECKIYDESFDILYNYKRAKRYLAGFIQILGERELLSQLSAKQKVMLFWHKYLRIPIPALITCCYILLGIKSFHQHTYFMSFMGVSALSIFLLLPINIKIFRPIRSVIRFVTFYTVASIELFIKILLRQNIYEK